jgi:ribosomal protein L37E
VNEHRIEKLQALVDATRIWRYWQRQAVTRSSEDSARAQRSRDKLLEAIDDLLGEISERSPESIVCPQCERRSYNPQDVIEGYCGFCHDWTSKPQSQRI